MENLYDCLVVNMGIIQEVPILEDMAWVNIEEPVNNAMPSNELTLLISEVLNYE